MWKTSRLYTCILNHYLYKLKRDMTINLLLPFLLVLIGRNEEEDQNNEYSWSNRSGSMFHVFTSLFKEACFRQVDLAQIPTELQGSPSCISEKYNKVFRKCINNNGAAALMVQ